MATKDTQLSNSPVPSRTKLNVTDIFVETFSEKRSD